MICKECHAKNITKAQYCQQCGNPFSEEERSAAYDKTVFGFIHKLETWKGYVTLDFITDHPIFKTVVLVLILVWGFFLGRSNGKEMLILESETYQVQQNVSSGDFYILTDETQVPLKLYLPQKATSLVLQAIEADAVVQETAFTAEDAILLETTDTAHYILTADYGRRSDCITVYVLLNPVDDTTP